jgi:hypothetical protein
MTTTLPDVNGGRLIALHTLLTGLVACSVSAISLFQALPEIIDIFFKLISELLDTHWRWYNASYKYRNQIVQIHYVAILAILPSLILGILFSPSRIEINKIRNIGYFKFILALGVVIFLGIQIVFCSGSETFITQRPEYLLLKSSMRYLNSFFGILFLQYLNVSLWVAAGVLIKSLFLKIK